VNWRSIALNWGFIGGVFFGLIFMIAGAAAYIGGLRPWWHAWDFYWAIGAIFLALAVLSGWKRMQKDRQNSK
jgi:type VI protein secretion system component VasK